MTNLSKEFRLSERLKLNKFKLNKLLELTKAINNNSSTAELISIYETIVRKELEISKLVLFVNRGAWQVLLQYGSDEDYSQIDPQNTFSDNKEIALFESGNIAGLRGFDVLIPVFHREISLAYLLIGDLDEDEIAISPIIKHMNFVQTLTNVMVVAIENKRLAKENVQQERLKRELELAAEMQAMLVPTNLPSNENVDVEAFYQPHQEVGGDYYDFIPLNEKEFIFSIADVSGKGVSAAFLMSNFQASLRALAIQNYTLEGLVRILNEKVIASARGEKFITFFIGKYNLLDRKLSFVNAGHNPPILCDGHSSTLLVDGCMGLGMIDDIPQVKIGEQILNENSTIICYTDGLVEMENEQENEFGVEKVADLLKKNYQLNMSDFNDLLLNEFHAFRGSVPTFDDIALLSCRFF